MDWETLYCPNRHCKGYGRPFPQGLLVKNGSSRGQPQALCRAGGGSVSIRYGTAYLDLETDPAIFETAVRALAEGNSLHATARIVQVDKDTACDWLHRAGHHCRLVMLSLWHHLHVTECQVDELWSFVHTKEQHLPLAKLYRETYGDAWVWIAFAPVWHLVYAQVVKKREKGRVVEVHSQVVFGTDAQLQACWDASAVSSHVNTSSVERDNLTLRQSNRRLTRRSNGFSKELPWFEKQLWLSLAYYHLVLPHPSLRQPLTIPEPTRGSGSDRRWRPVTPAMAAGITDHVWSTTELLSYRPPAPFLEQLSQIEPLFPLTDEVHQGN